MQEMPLLVSILLRAGIGIVLFYLSTLLFSLTSRLFLTLLKRTARRSELSNYDYFWALNSPVLISLAIAVPSTIIACCHQTHEVHLALSLGLFSAAGLSIEITFGIFFFFAIVKTILYFIKTQRWMNNIKRRSLAPSPKLCRALKRLQTEKKVRFPFYEIDDLEIPSATFGWLSPWGVISKKLVKQLSVEELEGILWHEFFHGLKLDNLKKVCSYFSLQVLTVLPFLKSIFESWQETTELCCDEFAVKKTKRPLDVASALTKAAKDPNYSPSEIVPSSFLRQDTGVLKRIQAILWLREHAGPLLSPAKLLPYVLLGGVLWFLLLTKAHLAFSLWCLAERYLGSH